MEFSLSVRTYVYFGERKCLTQSFNQAVNKLTNAQLLRCRNAVVSTYVYPGSVNKCLKIYNTIQSKNTNKNTKIAEIYSIC